MMSPYNFRGTDVNYYSICHRRAWLSIHEVYITSDSEYVKEGKYLNDLRRNTGLRQMRIGRSVIDYFEERDGKGIVHEFKRGRKVIDADLMQISHYLYNLYYSGVTDILGIIHTLGSKGTCSVTWSNERITALNEIYAGLIDIETSSIPRPIRNYYCNHGCSFHDFCWS